MGSRAVDSEAPQNNKSGVERRQYRRVRLVAQVQCQALGRTEILVTRDVSAGGMFLIAQSPFSVDCDLLLTFRLAPQESVIACGAKVVYSHAGVGMGVKFAGISAETRRILQRFVDGVA